MAQENVLGTEKVGRLLLQFSVPTAMALIVNSLYNMVDQIFIGRAVGVDGVAATNVAFPLFILTAAIALLIGDGCAANISLALGRKEKEQAEKFLFNGLYLLFFGALSICFAGLAFLKPLLLFFGASAAVLEISMAYTNILLWSIPFSMATMAMTAIIRADGNPRYMMKTMLLGAVINLILDPIFIFKLDMGVKGAALATIIGQFVSGGLALAYIRKLKHIRYRGDFVLEKSYMGKILKLGFPSFCTQTATAATQIVLYNLMRKYGQFSPYGSEITLSGYGIMTKLYQIAHAMFVGLAAGTQPIHGFNFGAGKRSRVRQTYRIAFVTSMVISFVWFGIFRWGGAALAGVFVQDEPLFLEFTQYCFRSYMLAFFLYGPPQITSSFFQALGKPMKALFVALARQVLFLIPLALLLSGQRGLEGALLAAPAADTLAFVMAMAMVIYEFRSWKRPEGNEEPRCK